VEAHAVVGRDRSLLDTRRHFEYVIHNHDGEESHNWEAFYYPLGEARRAFPAGIAFLRSGATVTT